jgi:hypothetical protein
LALACGCATKATDHPSAAEEALVREKFAEVQAAIKNRDADRLWALLDPRSQADAERAAKSLQTSYAKGSPEEKGHQAEELGVPEAELAGLTGKGLLKTKRFHDGKYHELPESRIERIAVQKNNATVYYLEPDGDKEKLILTRQEGDWKVWLAMPKIP